MSEQQQVQQQLWKIANELRGKMDANEFKDYMLDLFFISTSLKKCYHLQTSF